MLSLLYHLQEKNTGIENIYKTRKKSTKSHVGSCYQAIFLERCPFRSSHRGCSAKKSVLKNFANSTGKHLVLESLLTEAATGGVLWKKVILKILEISQENTCVGVFLIKSVKNFVKKRLQHSCSPVKFAKFLRTPILKNKCERLLPSIDLFPKGCIFCETLLYCIRLG